MKILVHSVWIRRMGVIGQPTAWQGQDLEPYVCSPPGHPPNTHLPEQGAERVFQLHRHALQGSAGPL